MVYDKVLIINGVDVSKYLSSYKPYPNTMVTNEERNAKGDLTFDIVNKKTKIESTVKAGLKESDVQIILNAVDSYKVTCQYRDTRTGIMKTINAYVPDPQPEPKIIKAEKTIYGEFALTVIEM